MTASKRWRDRRRIVLFVGLFALCCLLAFAVRFLVAGDSLSDLSVVVLQLGTLLVFVCVAALALRAAWRSERRLERAVLWILPIALALVGATFAKASYANVSVALQSLTDRPDGTGTAIVVGPSGHDIRLTGDITEGAATKLGAILDAHPKIARIHLTSEGGLADEGEALRQVIAAHKLTTYVPDYCVSACTLAFVGGRERLVMTNARLGFHAPYEEGLFGQTFEGDSSQERANYLAAGIAPDFIDAAFAVAPKDIWTPETERLLAAHVVTGVVDRYRFPDSNLDGIADAAGARATLLRNFPLTQALDGTRRGTIDRLAAWYVEAYKHGRSEGEIVDELKSMIGTAASVAMKGADDETLVGFGRFILTAMAAAESDETCAAIGSEASLMGAESALSDEGKSADTLAVALLSRALKARRHAPAEAAQMATTLVLAGAARRCAAVRAVYTQALSRPRPEAAARIRALITPPSTDAMPNAAGDIVH